MTMTSFAFSCILLELLSFLITDADHLVYFATGVMIVCLLPIFYLVFESPMYLYKHGRVMEMITTLQSISKRNSKALPNEYFEEKLSLPAGIDPKLKKNKIILRKNPAIHRREFEDYEPEEGVDDGLEGFDGYQDASFVSAASVEPEIEEIAEEKTKEELDEESSQNSSRRASRALTYSDDKKETSFLAYLRSDRQNIVNLAALLINSAAAFVLYYGLASSVQDLGLPIIQLNGILMSLTSLAGYMYVAYRGPKLLRVRVVKICSFLEILCALTLASFSLLPSSNTLLLIESGIAAFFLPMVNATHLSITYIQISELTPTRFRGFVVALVLLFGKFFGSVTPFVEGFLTSLGLHVVVGCSYFSFLALPMCFCMTETLGRKKMY